MYADRRDAGAGAQLSSSRGRRDGGAGAHLPRLKGVVQMRPGARTDVGPPLRFLTSGPSLGFGAWAVGGTGWGAAAAERARLAAIHRALELGVTFFDTAPTYGDGTSETLLGQALKADRDRVAIATKVGPRDDPRRSLEASLRRLATDYGSDTVARSARRLGAAPRAAPHAAGKRQGAGGRPLQRQLPTARAGPGNSARGRLSGALQPVRPGCGAAGAAAVPGASDHVPGLPAPGRGTLEREVSHTPGVPRRRSPTQDLLVQRQGVRAPADGGRATRRDRASARHAAVGARARLGPRTTGRRYRPGGSAQPRAGGAESCRRPTPPTRCAGGGRSDRGGCVPVSQGNGSAQARCLQLGRARAFHRPSAGWENQRGADRRPVDGRSRDSHGRSASQGIL